MMRRDGEQYLRAAQRIAASNDPREEILHIAQLASRAARQRKRAVVGGSVLGTLLVGVLIWQTVASTPGSATPSTTPTPTPTVDVAQEEAWAASLFTTAAEPALSEADALRLRRYMQRPSLAVEDTIAAWSRGLLTQLPKRKPSPAALSRLRPLLYATSNLAQTWALNILTTAGEEIPEERLRWFLSNPEPRLIATAMRATFVHCARTGSFAHPESIETFVYGEDREVQKTAILALSSLKKYVPPDRLMDFLESGDREIRQLARALLRRKGQ